MDPEDISERAQTLADEAERLSEAAEGLASDATRMVIETSQASRAAAAGLVNITAYAVRKLSALIRCSV